MHEPVWKEGPNGSVDLASGEDLLLAGAAFSLEEAAGDLARRVALLPVLDREREERQVGGAVPDRCGTQDDGVAVLNQARALREFGHAADLERERAPSELALHPLNHVVLLTSVSAGDHPRPWIRCRSAVSRGGESDRRSGARAPTQSVGGVRPFTAAMLQAVSHPKRTCFGRISGEGRRMRPSRSASARPTHGRGCYATTRYYGLLVS